MIQISTATFKRGASRVLAMAIFLVMAPCQGQTTEPRAELPQVRVGDRWKQESKDKRTGVREAETDRTVTLITPNGIEGTENDGKFSWTSELNPVESASTSTTGDPRFLSFPIVLGKKWSFKYSYVSKISPNKGRTQLDAEVVAYEKVVVAAGSFDAFRIEAKGYWNNDRGGNGRTKSIYWYAPAARMIVRTEYEDGYNNWTRDLIEYQLQP